MAGIRPLDYLADYYRTRPNIYELPIESSGLADDDLHIKTFGRLASLAMLRHEKTVLRGMRLLVEGSWEECAEEMKRALATMPGLTDARLLAAIAYYMQGKPALVAKTLAIEIEGANPDPAVGRYFRAWLPSLRILVRLDDDLVAPFYPNRLGLFALAIAAQRELGNFRDAGIAVEQAADEFGLTDELLYSALLLHLRTGGYTEAWRLVQTREYKNRDSLDVGLLMLRAEAMIGPLGINRALSEYRSALQFRDKRCKWLMNRARWRIAELYQIGGYFPDEREALCAIEPEYFPAHLNERRLARIAELPAPKEEPEGLKTDERYFKRFDYVWRGKVPPDEPVDFLEV
ncbi:MAG: hypothetical protein HRF49_01340 [bacterium]|jgi:hypothetical protein